MRLLNFTQLFFRFLFFPILLEVCNNSWVNGECLDDQKTLLLQLNQSLTLFTPLSSYLESSKLGSWSWNTDCCKFWDGVTCDRSGHVISLDLSSEFLYGGLSSLFKLQNLERINLAYNSFFETPIPSGFDRLINLTYLNLSNSGFTGQIPIGFLRLTRLVTLDLSTFQPDTTSSLTLKNPDLYTLTRNLKELRVLSLDGIDISAAYSSEWCRVLSNSLPKLQVLSLSNCHLSGPFDSSLLQLRSLSELRLNQNNISAEVPELFSEFLNLTALHLSSCGFYGVFPKNILQLRKLRTLYLSNNKLLQGSLPEFPKDALLQRLVLSDISFSGELPNSIGNLRLLSHLELENCSFNGSIPTSLLSNLNHLQHVDLSLNNFTGLIPSIGWSKNLVDINLSYNRLAGPIPDEWNRLSKLVNLNLENNLLNGTIPVALFTLPSLRKLQLRMNQFTGHLGEFSNGSSSPLELLDLSINKLDGATSPVLELSRLKVLRLCSNNFSGTVRLDMLFHKFRNLSSLDFSSNSLSIITAGINYTSVMPQLGTLNLRSCNLTDIPIFLRRQSMLSYLDLSNNQIHGKIPNWFWKLGNITQLNLSHNFLEDPDRTFPDNSFQFISLLDLHFNKLQGTNLILPQSAAVLDYSQNNITSFPANISSYLSVVMSLTISSNQLTGEIPVSICEAFNLKVLDLSHNNLSGDIPPCLLSNLSLGVLNLRGNNLNGSIPETFSETCSLKTFDLNRNRFGSQIPRSLANCTGLEVLDLGNNQLHLKEMLGYVVFPCPKIALAPPTHHKTGSGKMDLIGYYLH